MNNNKTSWKPHFEPPPQGPLFPSIPKCEFCRVGIQEINRYKG